MEILIIYAIVCFAHYVLLPAFPILSIVYMLIKDFNQHKGKQTWKQY